MSEKDPTSTDPRRQLRQRLQSLREAGVEYAPSRGELPFPPPAEPVALPVVEAAPTLFDAPGAWANSDAAAMTPDQRRAALDALAVRVAGCTRCPQLAATRTQTVFGIGRLDPDICFVGEAPGEQEDRTGEPFVGAAGQLLTRIIEACGMSREDVFILNTLKCRPPGNRPPSPTEAGNCREYLDRQIELVRPKSLCALGATAAKNLLQTDTGITRLRGRFLSYRDIPVMCTFHPSYLLREPAKKREVWEDMQKLLARLGRPIPGKGGGA